MTWWRWMVEPLRKYAVFEGRARRAEYWWFTLFWVVVSAAARAIDHGLFGDGAGLPSQVILSGVHVHANGSGIIYGLVLTAFFLPQLAVGVRRYHDVDRSGWWVTADATVVVPITLALGVHSAEGVGFAVLVVLLVLAVVGFVGLSIVLLVWQCTEGTSGDNRFGPDPLECSDADAA